MTSIPDNLDDAEPCEAAMKIGHRTVRRYQGGWYLKTAADTWRSAHWLRGWDKELLDWIYQRGAYDPPPPDTPYQQEPML